MGLQRRVIIAPGDTVDVSGPVVSTIRTVFSTANYNTYKFIDIPVFVGYEYGFGEWKTDVSFGLFTNIRLSSKGRIPNSPTSIVNLETNGREIYRDRVGFGFQFGIGVSKSLTDKFSMRVNPTVRNYSNNLLNESVGLSQKYLLFGGTLGLRMYL